MPFSSLLGLSNKEDHPPAVFRAYGIALHLHQAVDFRLEILRLDGADLPVTLAAAGKLDLAGLHALAGNAKFLPEFMELGKPVEALPARIPRKENSSLPDFTPKRTSASSPSGVKLSPKRSISSNQRSGARR